ncbi:hydantoinase B/oxoprolinase family protein [Paroceanicella profunda]|uniref:Hydantoinase B/oxoprolinase family protein n=1 Tax=Paroceanicella profunda TaxID=2579971 RepID=A0A5B8FXG1_9RHOB|nr:hydantoinase B/oxoprolinase family protein [Paroceanicella profunda]QDL91182.1 hydantoinase B/oxoprolinase family protein [Paroceanicella profunda]
MSAGALPPRVLTRLEPMRLSLQAAADRMQESLIGGAFSSIARESGDGAAALFLADGRLIAQANSLPLLLGALGPAVAAVLERFPPGDMREGEAYLLNDPWAGGAHLPDLTLVRPAFAEGRLVGFAAASLHHQDIGGTQPGSIPPDATSIFHEGLRIPPLRAFVQDRPDPGILALLGANSRTPALLRGDLGAQLAATRLGGAELAGLAAREGAGFAPLTEALIDQSARLTAAALAARPDGTATWEDALDGDGISPDPVPIRVTLVKRGARLAIDFTGSAPQTAGPVNAAPAAMMAAALFFMRSLAPDAPNNAGCLAALTLTLPEGSVVNPRFPAAVNARTGTVKLACNAILGAWSRICPEVAAAAHAGVAAVLAFGGEDGAGAPFFLTEIVASGAGASADGPGAEGLSTDVGNARNMPVELLEARLPVRVEGYGLAPNSGGAGAQPGGRGIARSWRLLEGRGTVSYRSERHATRARGACGGGDGAPSAAWVERADGTRLSLPARARFDWAAGDVFHVQTAGGGGWGRPGTTQNNQHGPTDGDPDDP